MKAFKYKFKVYNVDKKNLDNTTLRSKIIRVVPFDDVEKCVIHILEQIVKKDKKKI